MQLETSCGTKKSPGRRQECIHIDRDMEGAMSVAIQALSQSAEIHHTVERIDAFSFKKCRQQNLCRSTQ